MDTGTDLRTADRDTPIAIIVQQRDLIIRQQAIIKSLEKRVAQLEGRAKSKGSGRMPGLKPKADGKLDQSKKPLNIAAAHDWEGFGGVACDGTARPGPGVSVSIATTVPSGHHSGVVATAVGIAGVAPRALSWGGVPPRLPTPFCVDIGGIAPGHRQKGMDQEGQGLPRAATRG